MFLLYRHASTFIRNGKVVWKHRPYCSYFFLNLKLLGWLQTDACSKDFLCGYDFDDVLAIFCSYRYSVNASEAVEKIATDEKWIQMLLVRYSLHTINISIAVEKVEDILKLAHKKLTNDEFSPEWKWDKNLQDFQ